MLLSLHIENVAVIRSLDIDFSQGFCVLTGETGAGKSLLIDSINCLLGARVNRDLIRAEEEKAMISAVFGNLDAATVEALAELGVELDGDDLMLQRTVTRDGKSQARVNGRAVTQSVLREAGALLINIHGQSDNQKLMQKAYHTGLLDAYARDAAAVNAYRAVYDEYRTVKEQWQSLQQNEAERLRTREMLEFQMKDIDAAKLKTGEEEKLTDRRERLLHQEKIEKNVRLAARALADSEKATVLGLIDRAEGALSQVAGILPECDELITRLDALRSEVEDIAERVRDLSDEDMTDPTAELDKIEGRLDTISRLGRKYGEGVEAILAFRDKAAARLHEIDTVDDRILEYEHRLKELSVELTRLGGELTSIRRAAAKELSEAVRASLTFLDMPKVQFEVAVQPTDGYAPDGMDDVEFLLSANPGQPVASMIRIASGGELSRITLAIRSVLNERYGVPTSIYDEVDTGISGRTARKVGIKLSQIAEESQVICVTHSAQIASLADHHYVISKTEQNGHAETSVRLLSEGERVDEVARILGGLDVTDSQRQAAKELMEER